MIWNSLKGGENRMNLDLHELMKEAFDKNIVCMTMGKSRRMYLLQGYTSLKLKDLIGRVDTFCGQMISICVMILT